MGLKSEALRGRGCDMRQETESGEVGHCTWPAEPGYAYCREHVRLWKDLGRPLRNHRRLELARVLHAYLQQLGMYDTPPAGVIPGIPWGFP